jgi:hypothetical protein
MEIRNLDLNKIILLWRKQLNVLSYRMKKIEKRFKILQIY